MSLRPAVDAVAMIAKCVRTEINRNTAPNEDKDTRSVGNNDDRTFKEDNKTVPATGRTDKDIKSTDKNEGISFEAGSSNADKTSKEDNKTEDNAFKAVNNNDDRTFKEDNKTVPVTDKDIGNSLSTAKEITFVSNLPAENVVIRPEVKITISVDHKGIFIVETTSDIELKMDSALTAAKDVAAWSIGIAVDTNTLVATPGSAGIAMIVTGDGIEKIKFTT